MDKGSPANGSLYPISMAAAAMAVSQAELNVGRINSERFGVILGTGIGGIETLQNQAGVLAPKARPDQSFLYP